MCGGNGKEDVMREKGGEGGRGGDKHIIELHACTCTCACTIMLDKAGSLPKYNVLHATAQKNITWTDQLQ